MKDKRSYIRLTIAIMFLLTLTSIQCSSSGTGSVTTCTPTGSPPPNTEFISTYIKSISPYPQCSAVMQPHNNEAIVITFISPVNTSTFALSEFSLVGAILYPPPESDTTGFFTSATFDASGTELTLWLSKSTVSLYPYIEYLLNYSGGLQSASGTPLVASGTLYTFWIVFPDGGPVVLSSYEYGNEFGAGSAQFSDPYLVSGYSHVPPHYPFTANFSRTLYPYSLQFTFDEEDSKSNLVSVDTTKYRGYANIMLGDWKTTFPQILSYPSTWPALQPFSYTVASSLGLDINAKYQLTFPTVHCDMPSGLIGNRDFSGNPLMDANYNTADQVVVFQTSPIRIDNPVSDNVNIPTITSPFYIAGTGTANIATVTITASTYPNASLPVTVLPTSSGVKFASDDLNTYYMAAPGLVTFIAKGYDSANNYLGSDVVEVNYQGSLSGGGGGLSCYNTKKAPTGSISSPSTNSSQCPTFTVSGTYTDNSSCGIASVTVNGVPATITNSSSGTYTATINATSVGNNTITVVITDKANQKVTYTEPINVTTPSVASITPGYAQPGQQVTLNGSCFSANKADDVITFSGYTATPVLNRNIVATVDTILSASSSSIVFDVPNFAIGGNNSVDLKVIGIDGGSKTFIADPYINNVVGTTCSIDNIYGGGLSYNDTVQSSSISGIWGNIGSNFLDSQLSPSGINCTPCGEQAGTCTCSQKVCYDNTLTYPEISFLDCGGAFGGVTGSIQIRIINTTVTHADGTPSVSEPVSITVYPSGSNGCP